MPSSGWQHYWQDRVEPFRRECATARTDFLRALDDAASAQRTVEDDVIAVSINALAWRDAGFSERARSGARLRDIVPIRRYSDFDRDIERETRTKGGVLTCSPVLRWLKTSGTTANPKRVPYTLHWMMRYRVPAIAAMWGTYLEQHPGIVDSPYATLDTQTVRENVDDFVQGVEHQAISNRHPRVNSADWNPPWYEAPWFGSHVPSGHAERMYHRIRHFIGRDLRFISAINPSTLISLRDYLAIHGDRLVCEVSAGTVDGQPVSVPDPRAADRLAAVLGDPGFRLTDVWPTLSAYSCWSTASAAMYRGKLADAFGPVTALPFMGCGTEGVTSIPIDGSLVGQPLAVTQAFFEFVPADVPLADLLAHGEQVETILFDEVSAGHEYHLIMSQGNGLTRLSTGDIYRVDRIVNGVPWIHFVRRDGVYHSFTGEKLTECQVTQAINVGCADLGVELGLYLCGPRWGEPPSYVVAVETTNAAVDERHIAARIDERLKTINVEYAAKRDSGRLAPLEVRVVPDDAIRAYSENKRAARNATQYKYQPFQRDTAFLAELTVKVALR